MTKRNILCAFFVIFCVTLSARSDARTAYVDDKLEITLRTGQSTQNSIIRMLGSGEKLDVIEVNDDTGYARVTAADGTEGFALARFITYEPIARDKLIAANRRLERNAEKIATLEAELREIKSQNSDYSQSQTDLETDNSQLRDELAEIRRTAASALQIADENQTLKTRVANLAAQITDLEQRNAVLAERSRQTWYVAGAGTLGFGILAGLILPRIRFKKRSKWGDL
ncbi:MAG: TIGR04211 family SH3 domain-containing protein [Gammaproteobacteria bacterium]|nr:TIGR04211 family SH3 domain-containing protein [Gammaproteobacteria bacterium]